MKYSWCSMRYAQGNVVACNNNYKRFELRLRTTKDDPELSEKAFIPDLCSLQPSSNHAREQALALIRHIVIFSETKPLDAR